MIGVVTKFIITLLNKLTLKLENSMVSLSLKVLCFFIFLFFISVKGRAETIFGNIDNHYFVGKKIAGGTPCKNYSFKGWSGPYTFFMMRPGHVDTAIANNLLVNGLPLLSSQVKGDMKYFYIIYDSQKRTLGTMTLEAYASYIGGHVKFYPSDLFVSSGATWRTTDNLHIYIDLRKTNLVAEGVYYGYYFNEIPSLDSCPQVKLPYSIQKYYLDELKKGGTLSYRNRFWIHSMHNPVTAWHNDDNQFTYQMHSAKPLKINIPPEVNFGKVMRGKSKTENFEIKLDGGDLTDYTLSFISPQAKAGGFIDLCGGEVFIYNDSGEHIKLNSTYRVHSSDSTYRLDLKNTSKALLGACSSSLKIKASII